MAAMRRTVWSLLAVWLLQLLLASSGWALARAPVAHQHAGQHAGQHANPQALAARAATLPLSAPPCHGPATPRAAHSSSAQHAPAAEPASGAPAAPDGERAHTSVHSHSQHSAGDSHHCCAVGLGLGVARQLSPLPQAAPRSVASGWISLSTRPDLPPPI